MTSRQENPLPREGNPSIGALVFPLQLKWTSCWTNNRDADNSRCHDVRRDIDVTCTPALSRNRSWFPNDETLFTITTTDGRFSYLYRNGTGKVVMVTTHPCVWLHRRLWCQLIEVWWRIYTSMNWVSIGSANDLAPSHGHLLSDCKAEITPVR